jgi:hypothetical protein
MTRSTFVNFQTSYPGVWSAAIAKPTALPTTERKPGNPQWGQPMPHPATSPTEFEMKVKRMGLTQSQFLASAELRRWCDLNRNRIYTPESLLDAWRIPVDATLSGIA